MGSSYQTMRVILRVDGMTCVNCARAIEINLRRLKGVQDVKVSFELGRVDVSFQEELLDVEDIKKVIESLGYRVVEGIQPKSRDLYILILCVVASLPLMPLMFVHTDWSLLLQFPLSSVVVLVGGYKFYRSAWHSVRSGVGNMDLLVSLGVLSSYAYSIFSVLSLIEGHPFFETPALLITFVRVGKYIEERTRERALGMLKSLFNLQTQKVNVLKDGKEYQKSVMELFKGDVVVFRSGDVIPVDCVILEGGLEVDESLLTGESKPILKSGGDRLISGSTVLSGYVKAKVDKTFGGSYVSMLIDMIDKALKEKPSVQRLADRFSHYFVQLVIVLSLVVLAGWYLHTGDIQRSVNFALALLVVSCPCAFGIAVPLAIAVGLTRAYGKGILVKNPSVFERVGHVDLIILDKTGTLTEGKPRVVEVRTSSPEFLNLAYSIAIRSNHPYSRAIKEFCESKGAKLLEVGECQELAGVGVVCKDYSIERSPAGNPSLFFNGRLIAEFIVEDSIREEAKRVVDFFREKNIKILMLTGDSEQNALKVARELGIGDFVAGVKPEDKLRILKDYQDRGYKVCMVGDGINDAPAMAQAYVSIAMGSGMDVSKRVGDVVLLSGIGGLKELFLLSEKTMRRVKQNLFWAFIYNILSMPLAGGLLSGHGLVLKPELAGLMMAMSSLSVVINSVRR